MEKNYDQPMMVIFKVQESCYKTDFKQISKAVFIMNHIFYGQVNMNYSL